jgi:hypothetical protein
MHFAAENENVLQKLTDEAQQPIDEDHARPPQPAPAPKEKKSKKQDSWTAPAASGEGEPAPAPTGEPKDDESEPAPDPKDAQKCVGEVNAKFDEMMDWYRKSTGEDPTDPEHLKIQICRYVEELLELINNARHDLGKEFKSAKFNFNQNRRNHYDWLRNQNRTVANVVRVIEKEGGIHFTLKEKK